LACGAISAENVTNLSCKSQGVDCRPILHTWEVNFDSTGGDSGGPMYVRTISQDIALGTHVHSDPDGTPGANGWYTPIGWGVDAYRVQFGFTYSICVTASC
jgi:hypothetical protein